MVYIHSVQGKLVVYIHSVQGKLVALYTFCTG